MLCASQAEIHSNSGGNGVKFVQNLNDFQLGLSQEILHISLKFRGDIFLEHGHPLISKPYIILKIQCSSFQYIAQHIIHCGFCWYLEINSS